MRLHTFYMMFMDLKRKVGDNLVSSDTRFWEWRGDPFPSITIDLDCLILPVTLTLDARCGYNGVQLNSR